LNGSVEEGTRNFNRLKQASARTPFQLNDLAQAQNMLQGFGLAADEAFESLMMIGDIAAITGGDIQGIGIAFGQAAAEGRLMTRDIRQLINQGVPAIQLLADTMGVAESSVLDLASEGQISFQILQKAFREATSEGGMFADGMEQQSKTLAGIWSTLKDNVSIALGELGQSISDAFNLKDVANNLINRIQQITELFTSLDAEVRAKILKIVAAIGLIGPALTAAGVAISAMGIAIGALTSPITLTVAAIGALGAAVLYFRDNWDAVTERISDITWWRNAVIDMIQFFIENNPFSYLIDGFNAVLEYFGRAPIGNIFDSASESLEGLKGETKEYETQFKTLGETVKSVFSEFTGIDFDNMFGGGDGGETESAFSGFTQSINTAKTAVKGASSVFTTEMGKIREQTNFTTQNVETNAQRWPKAIREAMQRIQEVTSQIAMVIRDGMINLAQDFAFAIGRMAVAGGGLGNVFKVVLSGLADMAIQIGKIILKSGLAIEALQKSLLAFTGIGAIAAGAALIAIGAAAKGALSSMGSGGSRGVGSSGGFQRTVRSQQQSGTVEFVLKGDRLVGVLQNTSKNSGRVGRRVELQI